MIPQTKKLKFLFYTCGHFIKRSTALQCGEINIDFPQSVDLKHLEF